MPQDKDLRQLQGLEGDPPKREDLAGKHISELIKLEESNPGLLQRVYGIEDDFDPTQEAQPGLEPLGKYDEGLATDAYSGNNQQLHRAREQGKLDEFGNATVRTALNIVPSILGNAGSIVDIEDYFNQDKEMGNTLTRSMEELKKQVGEEFPIYRENPGKAFDLGDSAWWIDNGASIVESAASFVATGAGVGAGATKGLSWLAALMKTGQTGQRVASGLAWGANTLALNQAEAMTSATQVYDTTYKDEYEILRAAGGQHEESDELAKIKAAEAAALTVNVNRLNMVLNLTSAGAFIRNPAARQLLPKPSTLGQKTLAALGEGVQEAGEEGINFIAEKAGTAKGQGITYTMKDALRDIMTEEGLEAMVLGAVGGIGQTAITNVAQLSQNRADREAYEKQQALIESMKGQMDTFAGTILNATKQQEIQDQMEVALNNNNIEEYTKLQDELLSASAYQALSQNQEGAFQHVIEGITNLSDEEAEAKGFDIDPDSENHYKTRVQEALTDLKEYKKIYNKLDLNKSQSLFQEQASLYHTRKRLDNISKQRNELSNEYNQLAESFYPSTPEVLGDPSVLTDVNKFKELYYNKSTYKTPKQVQDDFDSLQELKSTFDDDFKQLEKEQSKLSRQITKHRKRIKELEKETELERSNLEKLRDELKKEKKVKKNEVQKATENELKEALKEEVVTEEKKEEPVIEDKTEDKVVPEKKPVDDIDVVREMGSARSRRKKKQQESGDSESETTSKAPVEQADDDQTTSKTTKPNIKEDKTEVKPKEPETPFVRSEPGEVIINKTRFFNIPYTFPKDPKPTDQVLQDIYDRWDIVKDRIEINVEELTKEQYKEVTGYDYGHYPHKGIHRIGTLYNVTLTLDGVFLGRIQNPYQYVDDNAVPLDLEKISNLEKMNPLFVDDNGLVSNEGYEFLNNWRESKLVWDRLIFQFTADGHQSRPFSRIANIDRLIQHELIEDISERPILSSTKYKQKFLDVNGNSRLDHVIANLSNGRLYYKETNEEGQSNMQQIFDEDLIAEFKRSKSSIKNLPKGKWGTFVDGKIINLSMPDNDSFQQQINQEFADWRDRYLNRPNLTQQDIQDSLLTRPRIFFATNGNKYNIEPDIDITDKGKSILKFVISSGNNHIADVRINVNTHDGVVLDDYVEFINKRIRAAKAIVQQRGEKATQTDQNLAKLYNDNFEVKSVYRRTDTDEGKDYVPFPEDYAVVSILKVTPIIVKDSLQPKTGVEEIEEDTVTPSEKPIDEISEILEQISTVNSLKELNDLEEAYMASGGIDGTVYDAINKKYTELNNKDKGETPNIPPAFKIGTPDQIISIDEAMTRLDNLINLDEISVKNVEDLLTNVSNKGLTLGAVTNYTVWLSNSLDRGTIDHEAFHVVFRHYLTDAEIDKYLSLSEAVVNKKTIKRFRDSSTAYTNLTDEQIGNLLKEEWLADKFEEYNKNKRAKGLATILKRLFKKLMRMMGFVRENSDVLSNFFSDIRQGKYRDATVRNNVYRITGSPTFKLLYGKSTGEDNSQSNSYIDPATSEQIINTLAQRIAFKGAYSVDALETELNSLREFFNIKNFQVELAAIPKGERIKKIREINNVQVALNDDRNQSIFRKEVKRRLSLFIDEDEDVENAEDTGAESWMIDNTQLGGFKGLSSFMRQYIAFTTMPVDIFGLGVSAERLADQEFQFAINPYEVYNYIERLLADKPRHKRLSILAQAAKYGHNKQVKAFYNDLKSKLEYDEQRGVTKRVSENPLYSKFLAAFEKTKLIQMMVTSKKDYEFNVFESNRHDAGRTQVDRWAVNYNSKLETEAISKDIIVDKLEQINLLSNNPQNVIPERIDYTARKVTNLFNDLGIELSPIYVKWSLIDIHRELIIDPEKANKHFNSDQLDVIDSDIRPFYNAFDSNDDAIMSFDKANAQGELGNIIAMSDSINANGHLFEKTYDDQGLPLQDDSRSRLTFIAKANAMFDESVSESTYRNSENKIIYDKVLPSFYSDEVRKWHDPSRRQFTNEEEFRNAWSELDDFEAKRTYELLKNNPLLTEEHLFNSNFSLRAIDGIRYSNHEGKAFGSLDPRSKILNKLALFDKRSKVAGKERAYYEVGVNETANTSYIIELPVKDYFSEGKITQLGIDHMTNAFKQEYERISYEVENDDNVIVKGYNDSLEGRAYNFFNFLFLSESNPQFYKKLHEAALSGEDFETHREQVEKMMEETAGVMFNDFADLLSRDDIAITKGAEPTVLPKSYRTGKYVNTDKLGQYYFNDYLNSLYFSQMMDGDQAIGHKYNIDTQEDEDGNVNYEISKSPGIEVVKRNKGKLASGYSFGEGSSRGAIIDFKDYLFTPENTNEINLAGLKADRTDAQAWNTLDFTIVYLKSQGKWNDQVAEAYKKIRRGDPLSTEDLQALEGSQAMSPSRKFVYRDRISYFKLSSAMLSRGITSIWDGTKKEKAEMYDNLESLIDQYGYQDQRVTDQKLKIQEKWKAKKGREKLHQMLNEMELKQLDYVMAASASKMASRDIKPLGELVGHTYQNANWREQVKTDGVKDKIVDGTQKMALVWSEQDPNTEVYVNGILTTAGEASNAYIEMLARRTELGFNKMRKKIIDEQGQAKYNDLVQSFMASLESSGGDQYIAELLNPSADGKPEYNMNITAVETKVQSMFLSYVSKDVLKHKAPGSKLTLLSDEGFDIIEDGKPRRLKHRVLDSDGNYYSECILTEALAKKLNLKVGDKLMGVRIPTQDKHSMINLKVVEFLPEIYGNTGVFPVEIVTLSGADFDIDSLYVRSFQKKNGYRLGDYLTKEGAEAIDNAWNEYQAYEGKIDYSEFLSQYGQQVKDNIKFFSKGQISKIKPLTIGEVNNLLLHMEIPLVHNEGNKKISATPATMTVLETFIDEATKDGLLPPESTRGIHAPDDKILAAMANDAGKAGIGPAALFNTAFQMLQKYNISGGANFFGYGESFSGYTLEMDKGEERKNDVISAILSAMTDNAKVRLASRLNLTIDTLGPVLTMIGKGVDPDTAFLTLKLPGLEKMIKVNSVAKSAVTHYTDFQDRIRGNALEYEYKHLDKGTLQDYFKLGKEAFEKKYGITEDQLTEEALNLYAAAEKESRFLSNLTKLLQLSKGLASTFAENNVDGYIKALGYIPIKGNDGNYTFKKDQDSEPPYDILPILKSPQVYANINSALKINDDAGQFFILQTPALNRISKRISRGLNQEALSRDVQVDLLSYLSLKSYYKYMKDIYERSGLTYEKPKYSLLTSDELVNRFNELLEDPNISHNRLLNYLKPQKVDEHNFLFANSFGKISAQYQAQLMNAYQELMEYDKSFAVDLFNYLIVKDNLQFRNNSFIRQLQSYAFRSYSNGLDNLHTEALNNNIEGYLGITEKGLADEFMELYGRSEEGKFNLPDTDLKNNKEFRLGNLLDKHKEDLALLTGEDEITPTHFYVVDSRFSENLQEFSNNFLYSPFTGSPKKDGKEGEFNVSGPKMIRYGSRDNVRIFKRINDNNSPIIYYRRVSPIGDKHVKPYAFTVAEWNEQKQLKKPVNLLEAETKRLEQNSKKPESKPVELNTSPRTQSTIKPKSNPFNIGARFPKDQIKANYADGIIAYGTHSTGKYAKAFGGTRTSFKSGEVIMISVNGNNRPNQKTNVEKTKQAIDKALKSNVKGFVADNKNVAFSRHNSGGEGVIRNYLLQKGLEYKEVEGIGYYANPSYITLENSKLPEVVDVPRELGSTRSRKRVMINMLDKMKEKFNIDYVIDPDLPVLGRFKDGKVHINPSKSTGETVFHEYAHPFVRAIRRSNPALFGSLMRELKSSDEGKFILNQVQNKYPDLNNIEQIEEAIVTSIGQLAQDIRREGNLWNQIRRLLDAIAKYISDLFRSGEPIVPGELRPDLSLRDLAILMNLDNKIELLASDKDISFDSRVLNTEQQENTKFELTKLSTRVEGKKVDGVETKDNSSVLDTVYADHKYIQDDGQSTFDKNKELQSLQEYILRGVINDQNIEDLIEDYQIGGKSISSVTSLSSVYKMYTAFEKLMAENPDSFPVLKHPAFDHTIKSSDVSDIMFIRPDGSVDVYNINISWQSTIEDKEVVRNGKKRFEGYTHSPVKGNTSKKERDIRNLSLYQKMLENEGIKVNSINILPLYVSELSGKKIKKLQIEPTIKLPYDSRVYTDVADIYTGEDSRAIIAANPEGKYRDVLDTIKASLSARIGALMNKKNTQKRQLQIRELLRSFKNVSEVDSIVAFVDDAAKHLIDGRDDGSKPVFQQFKELKQKLEDGEGDPQEAISKLVMYNDAINHFELLDDIRALLGDTLSSKLPEDDPLSKLADLIEVRDTIRDQFKTTVMPLITDILYPYVDTQSAQSLKDINQAEIERLQKQLDKLGDTQTIIGKRRIKSINKRIAKLERMSGVMTKEDFKQELESISEDHGLLEYYLSPMISSKDATLASFAKMTKDRLENARRSSIKTGERISKAIQSFKKTQGNKRPDKLNDGLYETVKVLKKTRNPDGTYAIELVDRVAFVQKGDISNLAQMEYDMLSQFNELMATGEKKKVQKARLLYKKFYRKNYSKARPNREINQIIQDKVDAFRAGFMSREEFNYFMTSNAYKKKFHDQFLKGELTEDQYVDKLVVIGLGSSAFTIAKGPELAEAKYGQNPNWDKLVSNPQKYEYYQKLTKEYFDAQALIPEYKRNGYLLPSVSKNMQDRFTEQGLKAIGDEVKQAFQTFEPDDELTLGVQDYGYGNNKIIPILYSQDIEVKDVSLDLASSVMRYAEAAQRYDAINKIQDTATATLAVVKDRKTPVLDSKGREIFDKYAKKVGINKRIEKYDGNIAAAHLEAFIDTIIYGKKNIKQEIETPLGTIRIDKVADRLMGWAGLTQIGGNPILAVANSMQAQLQTLIEGHGGEFFTKKDWAKANAIYKGKVGGLIKDFSKPFPESFLGQLINIYDPLQGDYRDKFGRKVSHSTARKLLSTDSWFFMMHQGELHAQTTSMLAVMQNTKLTDSNGNEVTLYEAYTTDENGSIVLRDDLSSSDGRSLAQVERDTINRVHAINKRLHGVYNEFDAPVIQRHWLGRLLMMYRKFIVPGVKRRYKTRGIDHELGGLTEGYYSTLFRTAVQDFHQLTKMVMPGQNTDLTEFEVRNIRRAAFELGLMISLGILTGVLRSMELEDDDYVANYALYQSWRLTRELMFYVDPGSAMDIISQPFVAYSVLRKLQKLMYQLLPNHIFEEYERDTGLFKKGTNKAFARLVQLFGVNGYNTNPEYAVSMLERFSSF